MQASDLDGYAVVVVAWPPYFLPSLWVQVCMTNNEDLEADLPLPPCPQVSIKTCSTLLMRYMGRKAAYDSE